MAALWFKLLRDIDHNTVKKTMYISFKNYIKCLNFEDL